MRIVGLIGFQGDGKTLTATKLIEDKVQREYMHAKVNWTLKGPTFEGRWEVLPPPEITDGGLNYGEIYNTVVGIDEVHTWFDSYCTMEEVNRVTSYFFTQMRKRDNDMFWTSQTFMQPIKRLRENTHYLIVCEAITKVCHGTHSACPGLPEKAGPACNPYDKHYEHKCSVKNPTPSGDYCTHFVSNKIYRAPFIPGEFPVARKILRQERLWDLFDSKQIIKPRIQGHEPTTPQIEPQEPMSLLSRAMLKPGIHTTPEPTKPMPRKIGALPKNMSKAYRDAQKHKAES